MIEFICSRCGQKLQMPETFAGKKCRCPDCKTILTVPQPALSEPETGTQNKNPPKAAQPKDITINQSLNSALDWKPKPDIAQDRPSFDGVSEQKYAENFPDEKIYVPPEQNPEQKRPAIVDIFLYPTSIHGLTIIAVIIGIPLLINVVAFLAGPFGLFIAIPGFFVMAVIAVYTLWYFCQCIRESAEGETRAPDVLIDAPSLFDMGWQSLRMAVCLAFFTAPPIIYNRFIGKVDTILYLLLAYTAMFFPIGLLAVVMHDEITALNPLLLIRSIIKTFFSYLKLVVLFYFVGWLLFFSIKLSSSLPSLPSFLIEAVLLYFLMIMAHLLGRFYWINKERLEWET
jgi:phage FluMu protein Com